MTTWKLISCGEGEEIEAHLPLFDVDYGWMDGWMVLKATHQRVNRPQCTAIRTYSDSDILRLEQFTHRFCFLPVRFAIERCRNGLPSPQLTEDAVEWCLCDTWCSMQSYDPMTIQEKHRSSCISSHRAVRLTRVVDDSLHASPLRKNSGRSRLGDLRHLRQKKHLNLCFQTVRRNYVRR